MRDNYCISFFGMVLHRSSSFKFLLPLSVVLLYLQVVISAEVSAQDVVQLEKVEVTGYRIKRTDAEGPSHVLKLGREAIEKSGASTLPELLTQLPGATVASESFALTDTPGAASINLRGLGPNRTLVLVNGRRVASNATSSNVIESFVDLNSIPLAAVERIEVLKDGASAIYGADAVAGVVNIILRTDYEGATVSVGYGQTGEGDTNESTVSILAGKKYNKTHITAAFDYFTRDELMLADRDFSKSANHTSRGGISYSSAFGNPGSAFLLSSNSFAADPACGTVQPPSTFGANGLPGTTGEIAFGFACGFDTNPFITAIPETDRYGINLTMNHELNSSLDAFAEFGYQNSISSHRVPATPVGADFDMLVPSTHPTNPYGDNVLLLYRITDAGPRIFEADSDNTRLVLGLKGSTTEYDWDASVLYSSNEIFQDIKNQISVSAMQTALANGTFDPFGGASNAASVVDGLKINTFRDSKSSLLTADLNVTGPAGEWEMDGGQVYVAAGVQLRHEALKDRYDPATLAGDVEAAGGTSSDGDRDVISAYIEYSLPVNDDLEMQAALRTEHYDTYGHTLDPKLGLRYQFNEQWMFRASAGTAFRAPSLVENFIGATTSFDFLTDTERCNLTGAPADCGASQYQVVSTGNRNLEPETASFFNLGTAVQITDDLTITVDYWKINHRNIIADNKQFILDTDGLNPALVQRGAPQFAGDPGAISQINASYANFAKQRIRGIDLDLKYEDSRWYAGTFASYLIEFERKSTADGPFVDYDGNRIGDVAYPHMKMQVYGGITRETWNGQLTMNHRRAIKDSSDAVGVRDINDITTVDLQVSYTGVKNMTFTLGGINIFDKQPPFTVDEVSGYEWGTVDPRGAFWYLRMKYEM